MKMSMVSVPKIGFSVVVDSIRGLEMWTAIIIESGYVPEIHVVQNDSKEASR